MSHWFILTILVTIAVGIVAFINKIFASRKYDQRFSTIILYGIMSFFALAYLSLLGIEQVSNRNIILSIVWGAQIYSYSLIMMTVLRYLPTSTYFISARLTSSFMLLAIGIIFFNDIISNSEMAGLLLGVFAMVLLFDKEKKKNVNYKKGVLFLLLGILGLVLGHTITKILSFNIETVPTILAITFLSSFFFSLLIGYRTIKENKHNFRPIFSINLVQSVLYFFYFVVLFYVYKMGDLGISYKIQSYSPFIPIILSAIIYKEKITKKKMIAMVLTIASLWFFV